MVSVAVCPKEEIRKIWPFVMGLVEPVGEYSGHRQEAEDIFWSASSGKIQLWVMMVDFEPTAIGITEIREYPAATMLNVLFVGGSKMERWLPLFIENLKRLASDMYCSKIEFLGRKGWLKVLAPHGFVADDYISMELPV